LSGYHGFGVCRDLDSLQFLAELRRPEARGEMDATAARSLAVDKVPAKSEHAAAAHPPGGTDAMLSLSFGPSLSMTRTFTSNRFG
jgi:hypothetical protein